MTQTLFDPIKLGTLSLKNRIVMAPLTRNRARASDDAPYEIHAEYYGQRADAGLIISEATQISPEGKGYAWTPGIYSDAQISGWAAVTQAVHDKGGKIAAQLWHVGRISHTSLQPDNAAPVAPSAIAADSKTFDGEGFVATSTPRALELSEMSRIVEEYAQAARNADAAGFDAVEIHAANGYLLDQFLRDQSNTRDDAYGGSIENRARLLLEVVEAVVAVLGAGRVGIRLSPFSNANAVVDSNPAALFGYVVDQLNAHNLAFIHFVEGQTGGPRDDIDGMSFDALRARVKGPYMANNGYDRQLAIDAVASGDVDLVAFGRPFIANPDLVARLKQDAPMNDLDPKTLYGGGTEGYTDYPTLDQSKVA